MKIQEYLNLPVDRESSLMIYEACVKAFTPYEDSPGSFDQPKYSKNYKKLSEQEYLSMTIEESFAQGVFPDALAKRFINATQELGLTQFVHNNYNQNAEPYVRAGFWGTDYNNWSPDYAFVFRGDGKSLHGVIQAALGSALSSSHNFPGAITGRGSTITSFGYAGDHGKETGMISYFAANILMNLHTYGIHIPKALLELVHKQDKREVERYNQARDAYGR